MTGPGNQPELRTLSYTQAELDAMSKEDLLLLYKSSGERQRLSLARALLRGSRILLLDEFTANLDRATAEEIEEELAGRTDCLTIAVTHHLGPDALSRYDGQLVLERQPGAPGVKA